MATSTRSHSGLVLLDACCLINLFATGRAPEILEALPYGFAVARYVATEEVLEIGTDRRAEEDAERNRESVNPLIAELIEMGALAELDVSSADEERELVRFAARLDDGEAHTLALAVTRGARVATDDKKAIRVFQEAVRAGSAPVKPEDVCLRTSELVFGWADVKGVAEAELARTVRAVAYRASFFPPRVDPHFDRWMDLLRRQEG